MPAYMHTCIPVYLPVCHPASSQPASQTSKRASSSSPDSTSMSTMCILLRAPGPNHPEMLLSAKYPQAKKGWTKEVWPTLPVLVPSESSSDSFPPKRDEHY